MESQEGRYFNPRSRMESDSKLSSAVRSKTAFQSTLSHGERRSYQWHHTDSDLFQSTLSHGERPYVKSHLPFFVPISIHALAWRATPDSDKYIPSVLISIHALAWRATGAAGIDTMAASIFQSTLSHGERPTSRLLTSFCTIQFQSTLSHGERLEDKSREIGEICISIHAPARGATTPNISAVDSRVNFNPRSRTGSD